ncbi:MAG: hypothetical protein R2776_08760 [Flavobacteriaceae bacterium]
MMLKINNTVKSRYPKPNTTLLGFFLFFCLFFIPKGISQKVIEKSWKGTAFEVIEILSDEVFNIEIIAGNFSEIKLQSKIAGENFESMNIGASEKGKILTLKPSYRPYFIPQNDKLAAHKVISIELQLYIPEWMTVFISSKLASLEATGNFKELDVNLRDGHCILKEFSGNAMLNTHFGNITVYAKPEVSGVGVSKKGTVFNKLSGKAMYTLIAESVNGNISLFHTPE